MRLLGQCYTKLSLKWIALIEFPHYIKELAELIILTYMLGFKLFEGRWDIAFPEDLATTPMKVEKATDVADMVLLGHHDLRVC